MSSVNGLLFFGLVTQQGSRGQFALRGQMMFASRSKPLLIHSILRILETLRIIFALALGTGAEPPLA
jgi:hypothetical protein